MDLIIGILWFFIFFYFIHSAQFHMQNYLKYSPNIVNSYIEAAHKTSVNQISLCNYYEKAKVDNPNNLKGAYAFNAIHNLRQL